MHADERRRPRTRADPPGEFLSSPLPRWLSHSASKAVVRTAAQVAREGEPAAVMAVATAAYEELEKEGVARGVSAAAVAVLAREYGGYAREACVDDEYAVCAHVAREYEGIPL